MRRHAIRFRSASPMESATRSIAPRSRTIVVEHPRLDLDRTLLRGDADGRRNEPWLARATATGHFSNDFGSRSCRRTSIRRSGDQAPGPLPLRVGRRSTHSLICALACAVSMPIGTSAEMQTAKKTEPNLHLHRSLPLRLVERGSNFAFYSGHKRSKICWIPRQALKTPSRMISDRRIEGLQRSGDRFASRHARRQSPFRFLATEGL